MRAIIFIGAGILAAHSAFAQNGVTDRLALFERQSKLLDGRMSEQYTASKRYLPKVSASTAIPRYAGGRTQFTPIARQMARKYGVPEDLFLRLVRQESNWNPNAVSHAGAIGLAQLMPATARALRVDPRDPVQNLEGGARYLAAQYRKFGNWRLALAAYNAGPAAVEKHGGIPPYRETQNYVRIILGS